MEIKLAWPFVICSIVFLILFIKQRKKVKQRNYEIQQLKEKNKKDAESYWINVDIVTQKTFEANNKQYNEQLQKIKESIAEQKGFLENFQEKRQAIDRAIRREREIAEKENFYRVCLSEDDIEDISELKKLVPHLRHREALPKLMWDTMVSRATKEMIKRVTGGRAIGGIYKITYIPTGEAYIGKTTDFGTRWQSHVQTALGMEKVARSTLHVHMASHGIQNYTFEILEEVPREKQTEREKFYIELYGTQKQLNMRIG